MRTLDGYGLRRKDEAIRAAGACLRYARETQRAQPRTLRISFTSSRRIISCSTVSRFAISSWLNRCGRQWPLVVASDRRDVTGMGARLLRSWLLRPCVKRGEVEARLAAVADLCVAGAKRQAACFVERSFDLERVVGRISLGSATPRDLCAMLRSLNQVPAIREVLRGLEASLIEVLVENTDELPDVRDLIARAITDDPPVKLSDGDTIREGYSAELDELRSTSRNAKQIIAALEAYRTFAAV